ncbi:uncharacterized protein LOC128200304 [Galleria mellonella]|uniref:Uncharacterized protein LOC128200304 n=1 Tax=Galleria mellonella TaxID=7137 RepID=A0ABM3MD46_GALME|nr:uncharacterized protein LOC128200304 [Galleria mellonella]
MRSVGEQLRAVRRQMEELTATVSGAMLKIEACNERIDGLSARMDGMERRMNEISGSQRDGDSLLRSIAQLKSELNERDQELLLNDVELSCVPEQQGEAVGHVILTLATKLGVPLTERDVVSATRMGRVPEPREGTAPRPRVIAVRLARRALRDQLIQAARVRRGATTEGAGLPGTPRRFYVNERLTRANRQLFQKTREAARQHGWRFCWTRNGKVYVRKHPGGDAVKYRVHSEDDLEGVFGLPSVCSLSTGQDDFIVAMSRYNADIVAINETWLREGEEARAPVVPGYRLRSVPRPRHMRSGRGGGVAFYIKRSLCARVVQHPVANIEQMWVNVTFNGVRVIIGTAYRPEWVGIDVFLDAVTESVTYFSNYDYIVLLGDFNADMSDAHNIKTKKIQQFLQCLNLKQVVTEPTHFSIHNETLLDIICTNAHAQDVTVNNITGSLGHAMVITTLSIKKSKSTPKTITYRPIKDMNMTEFIEDLNSMNWESVLLCSSVDSMVNTFNSLILSLYNKHAPEKTIKIRNGRSLPWITNTIKYMMDLRDEAFKRYRRSKNGNHKEYYIQCKKLCDDPKLFWRNIRDKININIKKKDCLPDRFNDPNEINDSFINVPAPSSVSISDLTYFEYHRYGDISLTLKPADESEIAKYLLSIKSNACGVDGIGRDMILQTLPRTLSIITAIINKSIVTSAVPELWKSAIVTPIPKVDNPVELKDLRPVSVLPYLSKILEKVIYTQLSKYVEENCILPAMQSGFRKGRGTVSALLDVVDNILTSQDSGEGSLLALLDYSRAFDSISIPLLLAKLTFYGLDEQSVGWFTSFLDNRRQTVKLVGRAGRPAFSDSSEVTRGVPQGIILGPLLFILYSADLIKQIQHCKYHIYADDVQLYIPASRGNVSGSVSKLNEDLERIANWSVKNAMMLNPKKSVYMVLGSKKQVKFIFSQNPDIYISGERIDYVKEARNLGIVIDSELRFETHVLKLVQSCFYRLRVLYQIRNLLNEEVRVTLCESLILSKLNYGDLVYGPRLHSKTQRLIQRIDVAALMLALAFVL